MGRGEIFIDLGGGAPEKPDFLTENGLKFRIFTVFAPPKRFLCVIIEIADQPLSASGASCARG